ncbi:hypothetical protein N0V82_008675 [Gnomoniopsis sp. IMI 355080]|nr:hypothetical protein N0V82_008675 [Gnomoniopsis sp. IMI 355080]
MAKSEDVVGRVEASYPESRWYPEELPVSGAPDASPLEAGLKMVEDYTGLPRDEVRKRVKEIREKAWTVYRYPCIGRFRFLSLHLPEFPEYQNILGRLKSGEKLLDAGCCFGYVLRQVALNGVPAENLAGIDVHQEFVDLGYELFQDRDRFQARFVVGDVLNSSPSLKPLDGQFDIIHASSLLHLFGWDDQVRLGTRLVRFFNPEAKAAMVVGRQVAVYEAPSLEAWRKQQATEHADGKRHNYHHDLKSWQLLWDEIGDKTGTKWKTSGELLSRMSDEIPTPIMRFTVKKVA